MNARAFTGRKLAYAVLAGTALCLILFLVSGLWIGNDVKRACREAGQAYGGDCVASLMALLDDEQQGFQARNDAIWALGQMGDKRALPVLESYYAGDIPAKEPLDKSISQYELKKAIDLASGGPNVLAWMWRRGIDIDTSAARLISETTVVVSRRSDPYYGLAQAIAQAENLEIVEEFTEVLGRNPKFIVLVASPDNLTSERLSDIGGFFQKSHYYPALGIISGSTIKKAEQLWQRGSLAQSGSNFVGGDTDVPQHILQPTIFDISNNATETIALNKTNLIAVLQKADYLYWTRHTAPTNWFWNESAPDWGEDDELFVRDMPQLRPAIIYAPTCSAFRPWVKDSIALAFADRGAAAYLGFINTPHTIAFMKYGLSVPGPTSWQGFPLGLVAQVQNIVAGKHIFTSPQFFMLGDPRIALSKDQPYRIVSEVIRADGRRIVEGESGVAGILAVKIDKGQQYDFLQITGVTSVSVNDLFYNSKAQSMNLGADKYVMFLHQGGRFQLELAPTAPVAWTLTDALADALDYSWVVLWLDSYSDGSPQLHVISLFIFVAILLVKLLKRKKSIGDYREILAFALLLALLRLAYYVLRLDSYSVSSNVLAYTAGEILTGCAGIFASVAGGLMLMKDGKGIVVKSLGLLFAVSRQLWLTGFTFAYITLLNNLTPVTKATAPGLLNYNMFWLVAISLALETAIVLVAYRRIVSWRKGSVPSAAVL